MAVHIYGLTVDIDPILEIAKKHNLKVIEDAAEVIGQTYKGKSCGSFGDISTFSFYPNKHITTGEGGIVMTDDPKVAEKCSFFTKLMLWENRSIYSRRPWLEFQNEQSASSGWGGPA